MPNQRTRQGIASIKLLSEQLVRFAWLIDAERDLIGDSDAVTFQSYYFLGNSLKHEYLFEAEVDQDLRAYAASAAPDAGARVSDPVGRGREREFAGGRRVRRKLRCRSRVQCDEDREKRRDLLSRWLPAIARQFVAIARNRTKNVPGKTVRMNAHKSRIHAFELAANERDVLIVIHVAGVGDHAEIAEAVGKIVSATRRT